MLTTCMESVDGPCRRADRMPRFKLSQGCSVLYVKKLGRPMSAFLQSSLADELEVVLMGCGIQTLDDLAEAIRSDGDSIADYITSSECRRAGYAAVQAAIQKQRKPVMMDAGLLVQAVVAEASNPQQMRSVGSIVRRQF